MPADEWKQLRATLRAHGIEGAEDLGRFVGNSRHQEASAFDERAAMPVLIEALPELEDPQLVEAVAGHLRRPWARPAAYEPLHAAFLRWATLDPNVGWAIGDSLGMAATTTHVQRLLALCRDEGFGTARQMVVYSLRRYKADPEVTQSLADLVEDPDVGLHAMSALRSVAGNEAAIPVLERVASREAGSNLGSAADRELRKARKALSE
jgi:hypothetical protein